MQVRLGFSVVTQLDEPIILVDEVLAVGDKRFREKCYDADGADRLRGPHAVPGVAQRERPAPLLPPRPLPAPAASCIVDGPVDEAVDAYNDDIGRHA